ncbi:SIR2 family protein [Bacillus sp. JRC01]|nr:SIR2 family protein [Bacillus sp. JRC01]
MNNSNEISLELATSLAAGSLTLFLGTGFSKFMTDGKAPSWLELLYECALCLEKSEDVIEDLFVVDEEVVEECKVDLPVCAQIIEEEFIKQNTDVRMTISKIIEEKINLNTVNKKKIRQFRDFLIKYPSVNIITTNYDSIISDYILPLKSKPVVEGSLIPKTIDIKPIFHIHGSITRPESIVLTEADYFKFLHRESYMSRKLFTLIQETTILILGYSLGDFNLNRILNEAKELKFNSIRKSDIYHINRRRVSTIYQSYYYSTFGVSVIENKQINKLLEELDSNFKKADRLIQRAKRLPLILEGQKAYTNDFLKLKQSFTDILLRADALGYSLKDEILQDLIIDILNRKKLLTRGNGAWEQYEHLAYWLVHLGSLFEVTGTKIEEEFIGLVRYSFENMSEGLDIGYSWKAHSIWMTNFQHIRSTNRDLIKEMVKDNPFYKKKSVIKVVQDMYA